MLRRFLAVPLSAGRMRRVRSAEAKAVRGFARHGLPMVFQPVFELEGGDRVAVEALARFPGTPSQLPGIWFDRAEQLDMLVDLELACARSALDCLGNLPDGVRLSINVSPRTVVTKDLEELLTPVADRLIIELTEHAPVIDYAPLKASLERLRRAGAHVAVDDVGAGFASLRHVLRIAPEIVKLDLSLTRELETDSTARALASALVTFCKRIGATVVAEGIESQAVLTLLRGLGVRQGQGYYLGRPEPLVGAR